MVAISYKCGSNIISTGVNLGAVVKITPPAKGGWQFSHSGTGPTVSCPAGGREGKVGYVSEEASLAREFKA